MADQILEQVRKGFEGQIDFEGQRLADFLATSLLAIVGGIAFVIGYIKQDIKLALYLGLAGTALIFVVIVPPWPFLNRRPLKWLPVAGKDDLSHGIVVDGKVVG